MTTDELIARAKASLEGITPGPWVVYSEPEVGMPRTLFSGTPSQSTFQIIEPLMGRDLEFIAAARQLVPDMIAALNVAEARAEQAEAALKATSDVADQLVKSLAFFNGHRGWIISRAYEATRAYRAMKGGA